MMKIDNPARIRQTRRLFDHRGEALPSGTGAGGTAPRITLVTPSYNQAEYLEACIDSVLSQGYPNLEYIIMDGGSTDGSVDIIRKYERHLAHWQSGPDGGQYPAIEAGLNRGSGEIMAWLNSDDRYWPGALQAVADAFAAHPGVDWLTGRGTVIDGEGLITRIEHLKGLSRDELLDPERRYFLQQESTFWRRDLWQRAGGRIDTGLKLAGDFELWLRFAGHADLHALDAVLGSFRLHQGQKTDAGLEAYYAEAAEVVKRERKRLGLAPDIAPPATSRIELITSLVPRQDTYQRLAVRSWLKLGFAVTSINPADEHDYLRRAYPEVRLVAAPRDGRKAVGKACVYVDDILAYLKTSKAEAFGIINADVYLEGEPALVDFLCQEARGALVYGSRQEVEGLHSATGWTYWMGFDYFFFDRSLLDAFPKSDFMLGIPWWDYWVPFLLVQKGLPIKHLDSPIAYHVSHPVAYSTEQLLSFGNHFAGLCPNSRAAALNRQYNRNLGLLGKDDYCHSMDLLAAFSRYEIYRSSQHIRWQSPRLALLDNGLVDVDEAEFLVTAVVSTYRSAAFIGECLADLVGQTIADRLEILVVDAASPEDEAAVVAEFQQRHPHIRYLRTPERIGVYAAWNLAARNARGRYLVSCSTNDRLVPHALEVMASALDERPEVAIAYGSSLLTRQPHQTPDRFDFAGVYIWPDFTFHGLLEQPGIGPHAMWRRRLHEEFGYFDEQYSAIADQDFWLRVGRHYLLWNVHDITGLYWATEESLSGNLARSQAEYREINERHHRPFAFGGWSQTRYFTKGIAARYETRMEQWRCRPTFHVYVRHTAPGFEALSRTIQSLSAQHYHDVRITVVSPQPAPAGVGGERFRWLTCDPGQWQEAIAATLPAGDADWLLPLADGDTVDPRTFLVLGEAIHSHPDWRLVFADEDELKPDGTAGETPHFKPGIDPDRLRSVPYLGEAPAISAAWLAQAGHLNAGLPGAEAYDLALRTLDAAGDETVGLVQDVLLHRPAGRYDLIPTAAHQQAVLGHLQRRGIAGAVLPGIDDTLRLLYDHPGQPPVAVAIPFAGSVGDLERALSSLLDKTRYPAYRIVVADCRRQPDPASDSFLAGIEQMGSSQLAVLRLPRGTAPVQALAQLLATVDEDYLVAWPETAAAVQEDWLATLMSHAQRHGIAAVAPRLVTTDGLVAGTGLELGVYGPADSPYRGVRMEYPGEGGTLVTEHRAAALDARCLLLKTAPARRAGGIDAAMGELWAADLAMRLAGQGALLWTPYAIALVQEDLTRLEQDDQTRVKHRRTLASREQDEFFRRWFPRLGRDPYRNLNWERNCRGYIPESLPALVYDPLPWQPVPKLFARLADRKGCGHYRIMAPMRALLAAGLARGGVSLRDLSVAEMSAVAADAWVFQRQITEEMFAALEDCARYSPAFRIYEIDDLLTQIPEGSPHREEFTPAMLDRFRRGIGLCQRLVVSTEPLAQAYGHLAPETVVMPNCLPGDAWRHLAPKRRGGPRPRVGWAGSASHDADLAMIGEVLAALAGEVDWVFMGRCPAPLRPYVREVHRAVDVNDYPARLAGLDLDLAIAPLEINAFNEAKSNLKLLEYGVLGYPVVCTDILPYQGDIPVTRVRNRPKDWIAAVRDHIRNPAASAARGAALREHVLARWMLEDRLEEWLRAWRP